MCDMPSRHSRQTFSCSVDCIESFFYSTKHPSLIQPDQEGKSTIPCDQHCVNVQQRTLIISPTSDSHCQHLKWFSNSQYFPSGTVLTSELVSWVSSLCDKRLTRPVLLTLTKTCRQGYLESLQQSDPQL